MLPLAQGIGMDEIHFCIFMVTSLGVGFITPPVGINLFAAAAISDEPFLRIAVKAFPSFIALILAIVVIAAFPQLVIWFR